MTLLLVLLGVVVATFLAGACRSLPKTKLAERLRGLGKNSSLGELSRTEFTADLGTGPEEFELVYYHAPAKNPAGLEPAVLIHGTPSTLYSWTELIDGAPRRGARPAFDGLAADRETYALEIIGHGIAPGDHGPYSFERCARFVTAAIRALGLERVHLVGSSYGGEFAWRAALNEPELIASLTLMDSSGIERRPDDWLSEEVAMREMSLAKFGWILNSRDRIEAALAPHFRTIPPDRVEEFFLVCENSRNWKAMVDLARDENGERELELSELRPPTLLLWGADDIAYSVEYYAERFRELIGHADFETVPETGHYPHEERPSEVVATLSGFMESHDRTH